MLNENVYNVYHLLAKIFIVTEVYETLEVHNHMFLINHVFVIVFNKHTLQHRLDIP